MLPLVGPDIEQALRHTFLLTMLHNVYPIVLFSGILITISYALYKPSRQKILLAVGLALLLLHFEYSKHIVDPLLQQTQVTLTTINPNYRFIWLVDKLLTKIIPLGMVVAGILSIVIAILLRKKQAK